MAEGSANRSVNEEGVEALADSDWKALTEGEKYDETVYERCDPHHESNATDCRGCVGRRRWEDF